MISVTHFSTSTSRTATARIAGSWMVTILSA
jgi:hypothetical protein